MNVKSGQDEGKVFFSVLTVSLLLALNYLYRNSYPFFRTEAVFLWLAVFSILLLPYFLCRALKCEWAVYAFLSLILADLSTGCMHGIYLWAKNSAGFHKSAGIVAVFLMTAAVFFVVYKGRDLLARFFVSAASVAVLVAALSPIVLPLPLYASSSQVLAPTRTDKPDIFFIILDEHIGFAGIPEEISGAGNLKQTLIERYEKKGFTLYEKAYSNYGATMDSIPSIVNARLYPKRREEVKHKTLLVNRLFDKLKAEGYQLNVYQSGHPDFSRSEGAKPDKIFSYRSTSTGYVAPLPLSIKAKTRVLLSHFIGSGKSRLLKKVFHFLMVGRQTNENVMTGALAADRVLEEVKKDASVDTRGTFFFIHLLLPHSSYVYDPGCGLLDPSLWEECNASPDEDISVVNSTESRLRKYPLYFGQAQCAHRKLGDLFEALRHQGIYEGSAIVITADHGARIFLTVPTEANRGRLTSSDWTSAYSAFLAVKPGGVTDGQGIVNREQTPLVKVIGEFFGLLSGSDLNRPDLSKVYLQKDDDPSSFFEADPPNLSR